MLEMNLSQNASQQQKLSYKMIQSINLLAEPIDELREQIFAEVEKNPALEIVNFAKREDINVYNTKSVKIDNTSVKTGKVDDLASDDFQNFLENTEMRNETLQEHLLNQLNLTNLSENEMKIGQTIIQNLDERGYHIVALESLFQFTDDAQNDNRQTVDKVLKTIQGFSPIGVACKNLQESLIIQTKEKFCETKKIDKNNFSTIDFLENHFALLENPRPILIQKKLASQNINVSIDKIEKILADIRSLEPYPAHQFQKNQTVYISPDVKVLEEKNPDDKNDAQFVVKLVKTNLPEVRISKSFLEFQNENAQLKKSLQDAKDFLAMLEMRDETLLKASIEIVNAQKKFFETGNAVYLKPLKMKDVAEKLEVHETTVSRIANGKYLLCKWGLFAFKYFFSNAVSAAPAKNEKTVLSQKAVKQILAQIIAQNNEAGEKPMSDQKLCDALASKNIHIARRTVTKYRLDLNVNSSYDR